MISSISFAVESGQVAVILGPSGSGKTTLLSILGGLEKPDVGTVEVLGAETKLRSSVSWVPQGANMLPRRTVIDNACLGSLGAGLSRHSANEVAVESLAAVGLGGRRESLAGELSGGELTRLAIARSMGAGRGFLLLDEPTGSLDKKTSREIQGVIRSASKLGTGFVVATHDLTFRPLADLLLELSGDDT